MRWVQTAVCVLVALFLIHGIGAGVMWAVGKSVHAIAPSTRGDDWVVLLAGTLGAIAALAFTLYVIRFTERWQKSPARVRG